jgi:hypothetical protein
MNWWVQFNPLAGEIIIFAFGAAPSTTLDICSTGIDSSTVVANIGMDDFLN